jgi:hypothetical protein
MPRPSTSWESGERSSNPASGAFMELCRGNERSPSGGSTCPSALAPPPTSGRRP